MLILSWEWNAPGLCFFVLEIVGRIVCSWVVEALPPCQWPNPLGLPKVPLTWLPSHFSSFSLILFNRRIFPGPLACTKSPPYRQSWSSLQLRLYWFMVRHQEMNIISKTALCGGALHPYFFSSHIPGTKISCIP